MSSDVTTASTVDTLPGSFVHEDTSGGIDAFRDEQNGLQVLYLKDETAPVVTFMITYHVGSRNEKTGLTGATHFLEHLMFKGTERFNKREGTSIFNTLQRVGARINASTWFDRTNYYEQLPKEHLPLAVEIEADRMRGALIDPDDLESERTVILNEFDRGQNEPLRNLHHSVWSTAFVAHPYHHPTIGWRSDIESVTPEGLRHFYDTFYWPNNATVSVIGDVSREEALSLVAEHFGPIGRAPEALPTVQTKEPPQRGERRVTVRQAGQLGALLVAFKAPDALHTDADALDVLTRVLASGKGSRLYRKLTDRGLTTEIFASNYRLRDPGLMGIYALLAPEADAAEVEEFLLEELERVKEGVENEEVQRAKNQLQANEAFSRDGSFSIAAQLNEAIAAGDWKLYTTYMDRIDQVTPEDVQRVAREYLTRDTRTIGQYDPT